MDALSVEATKTLSVLVRYAGRGTRYYWQVWHADSTGPTVHGRHKEVGNMSKEYKLPVRHTENYSGEHREWIEEYVLPQWLVDEIKADALEEYKNG